MSDSEEGLLISYFAGYYYTASTSYDIKWTMPHCVLTLRLIALTWDVYDGARDKVSFFMSFILLSYADTAA